MSHLMGGVQKIMHAEAYHGLAQSWNTVVKIQRYEQRWNSKDGVSDQWGSGYNQMVHVPTETIIVYPRIRVR